MCAVVILANLQYTTGDLVTRRYSVHESGQMKNMKQKIKNSCRQVRHLESSSSTWKRHWIEYFEKNIAMKARKITGWNMKMH